MFYIIFIEFQSSDVFHVRSRKTQNDSERPTLITSAGTQKGSAKGQARQRSSSV